MAVDPADPAAEPATRSRRCTWSWPPSWWSAAPRARPLDAPRPAPLASSRRRASAFSQGLRCTYDDVQACSSSPSPCSASRSAGSPAPPSPTRAGGPDATVALDGRGDFTSVQAAIDAAPAGATEPWVIAVRPGEYRELVKVPATKPFLTLVGTGRHAQDVVIAYDNANGTPKPDGSGPYGTSGSASVTLDGADFTARNLTFANLFDEAAHPEITNRQAVAVLTRADRLVFDRVRFLGNQDTLYVNSSSAAVVARALLPRLLRGGRRRLHLRPRDRGVRRRPGPLAHPRLDDEQRVRDRAEHHDRQPLRLPVHAGAVHQRRPRRHGVPRPAVAPEQRPERDRAGARSATRGSGTTSARSRGPTSPAAGPGATPGSPSTTTADPARW